MQGPDTQDASVAGANPVALTSAEAAVKSEYSESCSVTNPQLLFSPSARPIGGWSTRPNQWAPTTAPVLTRHWAKFR